MLFYFLRESLFVRMAVFVRENCTFRARFRAYMRASFIFDHTLNKTQKQIRIARTFLKNIQVFTAFHSRFCSVCKQSNHPVPELAFLYWRLCFLCYTILRKLN